MIEDQELRDLFKAESDEHLQQLDSGLLHLEKNPDDMETLKTLFREAHSLKGAARMLGVSDVEALSHRFEDILGAASKGQVRFVPAIIDCLSRGLDDIRAMVREAVFGEPCQVSLADALARMSEATTMAARGGGTPRTLPPPPVVTPAPMPIKAEPPPPTADPRENSESTLEEEVARIDTIRVDPRKLDLLLNQVGELSVVRTRIKRRLTEIDAALGDWESLQRTALCGGSDQFAAALGQIPSENNLVKRHFEYLGHRLRELRHHLFEDEASLDLLTRELEEGIRSLRLLPLSTLFNLFPRMVRDLSRQQNKQVELVVKGGETTADKRILEEMKGPLTHLLRNAIHHGIEEPATRSQQGKPATSTLQVKASRNATHVVIEVTDDGHGLDMEAIRQTALQQRYYTENELALLSTTQMQNLIFNSGFSTTTRVTDVSGRGVGLDAVRSGVEKLKGSIQVESTRHQGTTFSIRLPISLATTPVFLVEAGSHMFAIPLDYVHSVRQATPASLFSLEGRETLNVNGTPVSVTRLADLLALPAPKSSSSLLDPAEDHNTRACIILDAGEERIGVFVDQLLDEMEVVMKPHSGLIKRARNTLGASILGDGEICMVLNPLDLIQTAKQSSTADNHPTVPAGEPPSARAVPSTPMVLLVEDSITTRTQEKRILESAGYQVVMAVDGLDALDKLVKHNIHAVVTDIQMPKMDGLALTRRIRQHKQFQDLPIILVTSLASEDDMRQGLDAGASAYLVKTAFDQKTLLDTLRRLV